MNYLVKPLSYVLVIALGSAGARIFAPKGGAMEAAPAAGAEMQAAPAAEPKMETNGSVMYAAPRMAADEAVAEEAPAAECAEAETTDEGAAFDPRVDAALRYAEEQRPGRWELLRQEGDTVTLRHESGEERSFTVDENGCVTE